MWGWKSQRHSYVPGASNFTVSFAVDPPVTGFEHGSLPLVVQKAVAYFPLASAT